MRYLSTRDFGTVLGPEVPLNEDRCSYGGFYFPQILDPLSRRELQEVKDRSFSGNVAWVLNRFFDTNLDSWTVEFAIGRHPVKLLNVSGRAAIAQTWHNPAWRFDRLVQGMEKAIRQSDAICQPTADWVRIAARIAVLFGIFGELMASGAVSQENPMDVVIPSEDFSPVMAVWYARQMGLPIATVVCACNENAAPWNLLHKGELRMEGTPVDTDTPACDKIVPEGLERLICHRLGQNELRRFLLTLESGGTFYLEREQAEKLREGISVGVASRGKLNGAIQSLYFSDGLLADPYTALAYAGLQDYRSRSGAARHALILSEESPVFSLNVLSKSLGISGQELKKQIEKA